MTSSMPASDSADGERLKICVLQPDYSRSDVDYGHYDPQRDLTQILAPHEVTHVQINKLTTFRQLRALSRQGFDLYVNLIEGYLDWDIPSIDVVHSLDRLQLPYTGPNAELYDPPKVLMKYIAHISGVKTSPHVVVTSVDQVEEVARKLRFPLFVKPAHAGDSLGIDARSRVTTVGELRAKVADTLPDFPELLVEEYIDGRELTVLVIADAAEHGKVRAFRPVEWIFDREPRFKTYAHKTSELHPDANVPVTDEGIVRRLQQAAIDIFNGFDAVGYARMDFRLDGRGDLYFLEVNFSCSIFYADGYEGSADYILKHDGIGQAGFAKLMVAEAMARHRRRVRPFRIEGSPIAGYGIHAIRPIASGEIVFHGEERAQRIVTRSHVEAAWSHAELESFRHYAYPLSDEVFVLWDSNPSEWAPQNHSCDPNTAFVGLDVHALRAIAPGEEITLDFATLLSDTSASFQCNCGSASCRGMVHGTPGNSVTLREQRRRKQRQGEAP